MEQKRIRALSLFIAIGGLASGFWLPFIEMYQQYDKLVSEYFELISDNYKYSLCDLFVEMEFLKYAPSAIIFLIPFAFGILTVFLCMSEARAGKLVCSAVSALTMLLIPQLAKSNLLGMSEPSGNSLADMVEGNMRGAYESLFSFGPGYYVFIVCFAVAWLLLLLFDANRTEPSTLQGIRCAKCGVMNKPGSAFCSACGNSLKASAAKEPAAPKVIDEDAYRKEVEARRIKNEALRKAEIAQRAAEEELKRKKKENGTVLQMKEAGRPAFILIFSIVLCGSVSGVVMIFWLLSLMN